MKNMIVAMSLAVMTTHIGLSRAADYGSLVELDLPEDQKLYGFPPEANGEDALIGYVGKSLKTRILYYVGWMPEDGKDWKKRIQSVIKDPEYDAQFQEPWTAATFAPGIHLNKTTGVITWTPFSSGNWPLYPAVRDKQNGESPYGGDGYWWTKDSKVNGKTWISAKRPTILVILAEPTGKEFRLSCTWDKGRSGRLLLEIDYDHKLVKRIAGAKLAGVYAVSIDEDQIAWRGMYSQPDMNVVLDRKTGQLSTFDSGRTDTAHCEKNSEVQKF